MFCHDVISASQRTKTPAGFLLVPAVFSRTGIHEYKAGQIGITDRPSTDVVKVYRPPSEVFDEESMSSFGRVPVTNDHPGGNGHVTLDNVDSLSVGTSDPGVTRDGDLMRGTLFITNKRAIQDIEDGKTQLSNGYHAQFDLTPGKTPEGEVYDAIQQDIRGNHIAIVQNGRGGPAVAIADKGENTVKLTLDGKEYEVDQAVADALKKADEDTKAALQLASDAEEAAKKEKDPEDEDDDEKKKKNPFASKDAALKKERDEALAARDAAIRDVPTADQLDELAEARASVLADARRLVKDIKTDGKSNEDIRKSVVEKLVGDDMKGKSADYIEATFDSLKAGGGEAGRFAVRNLTDKAVSDDGKPEDRKARDKMIADASNAWETPEPKAE